MSLPEPGDYDALRQCLAEQAATPLPLSQLWHWTVIDGLQGGRLAIDCRIHHALADGVGIVEALSAMYDPQPVTPERPGPLSSKASFEPSPTRLLRDAVAESTRRLWIDTPRFVLKKTLPAVRAARDGLREALSGGNPDAPGRPHVTPTSLNIGGFSERRSLAWKTFPIREVKALARHFGCKVNDIGLLLFSFAMEHYLDATGEAVDFDLWCAMPLSTRTAGSGEGGNQVTVGRLSLHNTIPDAVERLEAIHRDAQSVKDSARPEVPLVAVDELAEVMFPATLDALMFLAGKLNLLGRLGVSMCYANAIMSNVPGPPVPVYVGNGVLVESIPKIPALEVIAVSGGFTSVEKSITIGFHCDGATVTEPDLFIEGVEAGWKALRRAMKRKNPGAT
jgi:WS/DGAT/MGAT family acyltransferase